MSEKQDVDWPRFLGAACTAIIAAPLTIGIVLGAGGGDVKTMADFTLLSLAIGIPIALPFVAAGGLFYLLLARFHQPRWWESAAIGFSLVATFLVLTGYVDGDLSEDTVIMVSIGGAIGAFSGLVFWYMMTRFRRAQG